MVSSRRCEINLLTQPLSSETRRILEERGFGPIAGEHPVSGPAAAPEPQYQNTVRDLATPQGSMPVLDQSLTGGQTTVAGSVPTPSQYPVGSAAGFGGPAPAAGQYQPLASSVAPDMAPPHENQPQQYSQLQHPAPQIHRWAVSL